MVASFSPIAWAAEQVGGARVALAREAGVKTATLNPLGGLTDRELAEHEDYVTVMDQNLAKLRPALACS